jgi:hypothetical protein
MRLAMDSANRSFAEWLSRLSHDEELFGHIPLPADIYQTASNSDFIDSIYPAEQLLRAHQNPDFFIGRAILTPCNTKVEELNTILLDRMEGELHSFNSHDEADLNDNAHGREELTAEFLHSLRVPNLPISHLQLRIGAPVMLMRNLDPKYGLCNGTRMTITKVSRRCLEVRINGGDFDGQSRLIFRCALSTSEELHFTLTRTQFPIRLAFAMTINKSQGQSLHHVGVDLRSPVFTHGQLYVALSRTTDVRGLSVLFSPKNENRSTDNIVYPEVLQSFSPRE